MAGRRCSATEKALELVAAGWQHTDAAREAGISRSTLTRARRADGAPKKKPGPKPGWKNKPMPEPYYFADGTPLT